MDIPGDNVDHLFDPLVRDMAVDSGYMHVASRHALGGIPLRLARLGS